ncbi:hypothetical protein U1Q18_028978 [Sarracenia purpurea var. burkii]
MSTRRQSNQHPRIFRESWQEILQNWGFSDQATGLDLGGSGISGLGCWEKRLRSNMGMRANPALLSFVNPFSADIEGLWPISPFLPVRRCRYPCRECWRTRLSPRSSTSHSGSVLPISPTPLDMGCTVQLRAIRLNAWLC